RLRLNQEVDVFDRKRKPVRGPRHLIQVRGADEAGEFDMPSAAVDVRQLLRRRDKRPSVPWLFIRKPARELSRLLVLDWAVRRGCWGEHKSRDQQACE